VHQQAENRRVIDGKASWAAIDVLDAAEDFINLDHVSGEEGREPV
jgi:hypothetical protein